MDKYKQEIKNALTYAGHLKFNKHHPWHRNLVALYCSLIEYSDSLVYLIENEKNISIPVVFRGLQEAFVDFRNLAEDETYSYHMEASYANELKRVFDEAGKYNNPFLVSIGSDTNLNEQVKEQKEKLLSLKDMGYKPLNHFEKFNKAGMAEEYRSVYNYVCSHSHNNVRSLINRFFIIHKVKNDYDIALFKKQEPGENDLYLVTGRDYLRNGSHNIHAILETGHEDVFPVRSSER